MHHTSSNTELQKLEPRPRGKYAATMGSSENARELQRELLHNIQSHLDDLKQLHASLSEFWDFDSYKFRLPRQEQNIRWAQQQIRKIAHLLRYISPGERAFHPFFQSLIEEGINSRLDCQGNREKFANERQVLKSFFQMTYFLEIAIKYGQTLEELPEKPPFGWSALLSLYRLA